jgi:hypothetical protein
VGLAAKVKPILDETYGRRLIIADIGLLGSLYLLQNNNKNKEKRDED